MAKPCLAVGLAVRRCVGALLVIGLLATASWVLAEHGKRESTLAHAQLPYYAEPDLLPRWDWWSRQHQIAPFSLSDQQGRPLSRAALGRGPTVVSFFFTACTTVCPVSLDLLRNAQRTLAARDGARAPTFLSISVTPQTDDAPSLRKYAAQYGLPAQWLLATGARKQVVDVARDGFFSDIDQTGPDGLPPHLNRAFLVDQDYHIRGIYDVSSVHEVVRMQHDIERL